MKLEQAIYLAGLDGEVSDSECAALIFPSVGPIMGVEDQALLLELKQWMTAQQFTNYSSQIMRIEQFILRKEVTRSADERAQTHELLLAFILGGGMIVGGLSSPDAFVVLGATGVGIIGGECWHYLTYDTSN